LIQNDPDGYAFVYTPNHTSVDRNAADCIKSLGIIAEAITRTYPSGKGRLAERERLPAKAVDKGNSLPGLTRSSLPRSRDSR
jgi:hypothetical protein